MLPLKTSVTLSLDEAVLERLADMAALQGRSIFSYVTVVLREYAWDVERGKKPVGLEVSFGPRRRKRTKTLTIDHEVLAKLRRYAELDARPLSQYINGVLKAHVSELQ